MTISAEEELKAICAVVGCQEKPGVALRLHEAHRKTIALLQAIPDLRAPDEPTHKAPS